MGILDSTVKRIAMKAVCLVLLLTAVSSASALLVCTDGNHPTCLCDNNDKESHSHLCNDGTEPFCTCRDGSTPKMKLPCDPPSIPVCPGACDDASDAIIYDQSLSKLVCQDGSRVKRMKCKCIETDDRALDFGNKLLQSWIPALF